MMPFVLGMSLSLSLFFLHSKVNTIPVPWMKNLMLHWYFFREKYYYSTAYLGEAMYTLSHTHKQVHEGIRYWLFRGWWEDVRTKMLETGLRKNASKKITLL